VAPVFPALLVAALGDTDPGLVDQGGRLECLAGGFLGHAQVGVASKLLINQRQELFGGAIAVLLHGMQ